jgi:trimeric autotransporter adhesin
MKTIHRIARACVLTALVIVLSSSAFSQTVPVDALNNQTCAGTRFGSNLNCTSGDFSSTLSFEQPAATALSSCQLGQTVSIDVLASTTSNSPQRYDGAYFIGENAINPSLNSPTSTCSLGVFPNTPTPYLNLDGDSCGDYAASSSSTLLIRGIKVRCNPVPGTNSLAIPYVLVFNNQAGTNACTPANVTASTTAKCVSNSTSSVTGVTVNAWIKVTKQTAPDGEPQAFSFTATESGGASVTPAAFNLSDNQSATVATPFSATGGGRTVTITETASSGWDPSASVVCTGPTGGSASSFVTVNPANRTITATLTTTNYGADCVITNTRRPRLRITKSSVGGAGVSTAFNFSVSNSGSGSTATSVSTSGAAVTGPVIELTQLNTVTTITETALAGWKLQGATAACTDANSARSGNPASFTAAISGLTVSVAAARIVAGADITCALINEKLPTLTIRKISSGGTGSFSFTGTNGFGPDVINTGAFPSGTTVSSSVAPFVLSTPSTSTDIVEGAAAGFVLNNVTCSGMGSGGTVTQFTPGGYRLSAAATAPGSNITCTFTNTNPSGPNFTISKSVSAAGIAAPGPLSFTITVQNTGGVSLTAPVLTDLLRQGSATLTLSSGPGLTAGDLDLDGVLDIGETWTYSAAYVATQANIDNGADITNTATFSTAQASARSSAPTVTTITASPALTLIKSASPLGPLYAGELITYSYAIRNTGNVTIRGIVVNETLAPATFNGAGALPHAGGETQTGFVSSPNASSDLTPNDGTWSVLGVGDTVTFSAPYTVQQADIDNLQ